MRRDVVEPESERRQVGVDRFVPPLAMAIRFPQPEVGKPGVGPQDDRAAEVNDRLVPPALLRADVSQAAKRVRVIGT